jgi:hypothetical protein
LHSDSQFSLIAFSIAVSRQRKKSIGEHLALPAIAAAGRLPKMSFAASLCMCASRPAAQNALGM